MCCGLVLRGALGSSSPLVFLTLYTSRFGMVKGLGFFKIRSTILGVPIMRVLISEGLYWGLYFGKLPH